MALADEAAAKSDRRLRTALNGDPAKLAKILAERLTPILVEQGITSDQLGRITKITAGDYQMLTKDDDGEAHIHDLQRAGIVISPQWDEGPDWPVVQPADPVTIKPAKRTTTKRRDGWRRIMFYPDAQIGYRLMSDGSLDGICDFAAMGVALQLQADIKPDKIVDLGDYLDFPEFSTKFVQAPEFAHTTQATLTTGHRFWAARSATTPEAEKEGHEGNHDDRLAKMILRNAVQALRLKQADAPDSWPVMSVPHLLRLDDLGVRYIGGYPAGKSVHSEFLHSIHGHKINSSGSTAATICNSSQVSVMMGHGHRVELHCRNVVLPSGPMQIFACMPGTLARIDGAVPSYGSAEDAHGYVVENHENWTQAIAYVDVSPEGVPNLPEIIRIVDGRAVWRDKEYVCDGDVPWRLETLADVGRKAA